MVVVNRKVMGDRAQYHGRVAKILDVDTSQFPWRYTLNIDNGRFLWSWRDLEPMSWLQVGASAHVRADLRKGYKYENPHTTFDGYTVNNDMLEFADTWVDIAGIEGGRYVIMQDCGRDYWTETMFDDVEIPDVNLANNPDAISSQLATIQNTIKEIREMLGGKERADS